MTDRAAPLRTLAALYRQWSSDILTVGISAGVGDSLLLREVDIPILVTHPDVDAQRVLRRVPAARVTTARGSTGWDEAILSLVESQLGTGRGLV